MTAETFTARIRPASTFSTAKRWGGHYVLNDEAVAALQAFDTSNTVSDVLDVLSAVTHDLRN